MRRYHPDALDRRDPSFIARWLPVLEWCTERYFRLQADGMSQVPRGPVMFVANHNGGILGPDLFCTMSVLWRTLGPESHLYALAHDFAMRQLTPLGRALQRIGAVSASRKNAERVLANGGQILVYPGGDLDAYRSFHRRNEVVILPRTGFVEVAREAGVPIVPVVAHGAHRSAYIFHEGETIARTFRMDRWARVKRFPLALALPWGFVAGPWLPYMPLPLPVRLRILAPVHVGEHETARAAAARIEAVMQHALHELAP